MAIGLFILSKMSISMSENVLLIVRRIYLDLRKQAFGDLSTKQQIMINNNL